MTRKQIVCVERLTRGYVTEEPFDIEVTQQGIVYLTVFAVVYTVDCAGVTVSRSLVDGQVFNQRTYEEMIANG